jgi:DNA gyrase/topoisomerase IV subunit A
MVTSTPPHNLGEVIDAVKAYMKDDSLTSTDLMKYVQGPDFPTGGIVTNKDQLKEIYETGVGKIRVRGRVDVEKLKGGKQQLVIVLINEQFSSQFIELAGDFSAYSKMEIHETSTARDLARTYNGAVKTDVTLPMQSVITIVLSE